MVPRSRRATIRAVASRDPLLSELFERAYRQLAEGKARAAECRRVTAGDGEGAVALRERVRRQYAELDCTVLTAAERSARSEEIFAAGMDEMMLGMRKRRQRRDEIGEDSLAASTETLRAILGRMDQLGGKEKGKRVPRNRPH